MKTPSIKKRGIEVEIGLVDKTGLPIFPLDNKDETAYDKLFGYRNNTNGSVKPEVINNMVEIVTDAHSSIENAQKEIVYLLNTCTKKAKEIGLYGSKIPRIKIDRENIQSDQIINRCVTDKDYYKSATQEIIKVLKDPYDLLGAGTLATHIHMSAENDEATFELFKLISNHTKKIWDGGKSPEKMLMNRNRFIQRNKIIEARKQLGHLVNGIDPFEIPDDYIDYIERNLFDEYGNLKRMHNIVALKKPGDKYTVELRSPDGVITTKEISQILEFTKKLIKDSIDNK